MISHVCHLWREVALSLPRFWSDFAVTDAELTEVMLARSKQAPLDVRLYPSCSLKVPVQRVLGQLHRIRFLSFTTRPSLKLRSYIVGHSAPLLQSLTYSVGPRLYYDTDDEELSDEEAFDDTAAGTVFDHVDMPALRDLTLKNSNRPWSSPLLKPTLTKLSWVESPRGTASKDCPIPDVLRVLSSMPLLEELNLGGVLPPRVENPSALPKPCHLPHLQTLFAKEAASSLTWLLSYVTYPPGTQIYMLCTDNTEDTLPSLLGALHTNSTSPDGSQSAQLASIYIGNAGLRVWPTMSPADVLRV